MTDKIKMTLNDQNIRALKPAPKGLRTYAWDDVLPGFCVRITDSGSKSFALSTKLPGMTNTTVLHIDKVGNITLKAARDVAREWKRLIHEENKDPRTVVHATEATLIKEVTDIEGRRFCNVVTAFLAFKKRDLKARTYNQMKLCFERELLPVWGNRQINAITTEDVATLIGKIAIDRPGAARVLLSFTKTLFVWAAANGKTIGSVASIIVGRQTVGEKPVGDRVLTDAELTKVWNGQRLLGEPLGQIMRMLILTGCRLNEVAETTWSEIGNLRDRTWTIPKERMKMDKAHTIPLTDMMIETLRSLKRGTEGDYVFSIKGGKSPYHVGTRAREYVVDVVGFSNWVNHDLRRTMRTRVSGLGVAPYVAEEMIAHRKRGVIGIYDKHEYLDEKRDGFEKWNAEVARIVGWTPKIRLVA